MTIRRLFLTVPQYLIGNLHYRSHLRHVMDPHHVNSGKNARRNCSRGGEAGLLLGLLGEKRLARRSRHHGEIQTRELSEMRQDLRILLLAFAKP